MDIYKIVMIAPPGTGRKTFLNYFPSLEEAESLPIGPDFAITIRTPAWDPKKLQIWCIDTKRFSEILPTYTGGLHALILMADLTDDTSLELLKEHYLKIGWNLDHEGFPFPVVLLGNKHDIWINHTSGMLNSDDIDEFLEDNPFSAGYDPQRKTHYFPISASTGENMEEMLDTLAKLIEDAFNSKIVAIRKL